MSKKNIGAVVLIVKDPLKSAKFYQKMLGIEPDVKKETFVMFEPKNGTSFGLWKTEEARPESTGTPGSTEICFFYDDVDAIYHELKEAGVTLLHPPVNTEFAYTFVAYDLDGNRVRIFNDSNHV